MQASGSASRPCHGRRHLARRRHGRCGGDNGGRDHLDRGLAGDLQIVDHLFHTTDAAGDVQNQRLLFLRRHASGDPHDAVVHLHVHVEVPQRAAFLLGSQTADDLFGQLLIRGSGRPVLSDLQSCRTDVGMTASVRLQPVSALARRRGRLSARSVLSLSVGSLAGDSLSQDAARASCCDSDSPAVRPGFCSTVRLSAVLEQGGSDLRFRTRRSAGAAFTLMSLTTCVDPVNTAGDVEHQLLLFRVS